MEICFKPTWKSFLTFPFSLICWVCAALQRSRLCSLILMTDLYASLFAEQNISMCFWCWLLLQCWCSHSPQSSATGHICLKIENRLQGIVKVCTKITGATLNDFSYLYEVTSQIILDDPSRPPSKQFPLLPSGRRMLWHAWTIRTMV